MFKKVKYTHIPKLEEYSFYFDHVKIFCNEQITFHEQKTWELSYIITGSGTRIIGNTIEAFTRNEVILIPPNIPHCWSFNQADTDTEGKIENITLTFSEKFLENFILTFPELEKYIQIIQQKTEAISFQGNSLNLLQSLLISMTTQSMVERISSFIQVLALIGYSDNSYTVGKQIIEDKKTRRMQKILLHIMNNYQNTITLDEMARLIELDRSSFCIFFKKMTGKTFFSYLIEYRIESSCQMIIKTTMTIAEVCYASGFKDVSYFNRVFKKINNITPTEYRNMHFKPSINSI